MSLRYYIHIDTDRLDSYVTQIRATTAYDKVPSWKVGLSLKGPEVGGTQERFPRPLSSHEKIEVLLEHLRKAKLLEEGRIVDRNSYRMDTAQLFRIERCEVVSVVIPPHPEVTPPFAGQAMWVSDRDKEGSKHTLVLLKDFKQDDQGAHANLSAYSMLAAMSKNNVELRGVVSRQRELEAQGVPSPREHRSLASFAAEKSLDAIFWRDPVAFFSSLGAVVGANQNVEVLYRVRSVYFDLLEPRVPDMLTFAYPIFISFTGVSVSSQPGTG